MRLLNHHVADLGDMRIDMPEFSVALRAFSSTLTPDHISQAVGIQATYTRPIESTKHSQREHIWEYQVRKSSDSLEFRAMAEELLDAVLPFADGLRSIRDEADLVLWCGCFCNENERTIDLTKESIANMANLGISMSISYYPGGEE